MDKQTMLDKLQILWEQLQENVRLYEYANGGCARETIEQLDEIKSEIGDFPKAPAAVSSFVKLPIDKGPFDTAQEEKEKRKKLLFLVGGITAVILLIYFLSHAQLFNTIGTIGILATAVVAWIYKTSAGDFRKKKEEYDTAQKLHASTRAKFHQALSSYEAEVEEGLKQYTQYELRYYEKYPKFKDTVFNFGTKSEEAERALEESDALIAQNGFISEEYYHLVPTIISMLKSGRADSYKEALNMAIAEERQDAIEAARQEEENRRIAAMERQAEEERRHNMMMERQQEEHNRAMERAEQERAQAEKDRLRADERARRDARQAESDARQRASQQCMVCAKRSGCRNPYVPGCGAFVPK